MQKQTRLMTKPSNAADNLIAQIILGIEEVKGIDIKLLDLRLKPFFLDSMFIPTMSDFVSLREITHLERILKFQNAFQNRQPLRDLSDLMEEQEPEIILASLVQLTAQQR